MLVTTEPDNPVDVAIPPVPEVFSVEARTARMMVFISRALIVVCPAIKGSTCGSGPSFISLLVVIN